MRDGLTVLKKIFLFYPVNYMAVTLLRMIGFAGFGFFSGLFIKRFFDHVSGHTLSLNNLYYITAMLTVVPLVQAINYYVDLSLSYGWVEIIRGYFRRNLLRDVLSKPGALPLPVSQGQFVNVLRSDVAVHEGVLWDFSYLLAYAVFSLGGLIVLGSIDWIVTVVLFAPLLLTIVIVNWLERKITAYYTAEQQSTDRVLGLISDVFNYSQAIKISSAERPFMKRLSALSDERARASRRNEVFKTTLFSVYDNMVSIGTALLLLLISDKIQNGSFSLGSFTLFVFFLGYISNMTRLFGTVVTRFKSAVISLHRIQEVVGDRHIETLTANDSLFLKTAPPSEAMSEKTDPLDEVQISNLCYTFPNSDNGIHDISFSLTKGSFTVITGKMGSGKTTLLRVILGLLPKTSGEIYWNGKPAAGESAFFVPPHTAYTPQVPYLFSDTIKENILLGHPDEHSIARAVRQSVFDEDLIDFEKGLETRLGAKGINLSGGQVQRVAASRMFVRDADLLVLDDISSALDVETEIRVWERLNELRKSKGVTLLVVTQKKYAMNYADHVIVLDEGKVKTQGPLQKLMLEDKNEEISDIFFGHVG